MTISTDNSKLTLVTGATGKTGKRVAAKLAEMGLPLRLGSRSGQPVFDWHKPETWIQALDSVHAIYVCFPPELAAPGSSKTVQAFVEFAVQQGVKKVVLLSGRGEEEAQACEKLFARKELEWTIVRASWFAQNFSEGEFFDMVKAGQVVLPKVDTKEAFIDADDIVDVAVAALTEAGHGGKIYEVTGPRLMSFEETIDTIAKASGKSIEFIPVTLSEFIEGGKQMGLPDEVLWLMEYLFTTVLDGRNEYLTDGIYEALGRQPKDFTQFAKDAAVAGAWA